jgi:hypothetical protein
MLKWLRRKEYVSYMGKTKEMWQIGTMGGGEE